MRYLLFVLINIVVFFPLPSTGQILEEEINGIINVDDFGANGNDNFDDSEAIKDACEAVTETSALRFSAGGRYIIDNPIECPIPNRSVILAYGARLVFRNDVGGINLNPDANPADTESGLLHTFRWLGGRLINNASSKTISYGLRVYAGRNVKFQDMHIQGFFHGIEYAAKDTFIFSDIHFFDNGNHIYHPNWATDGTVTIMTIVDRCHFAIGKNGTAPDLAHIAIEGAWWNFIIQNSSFNGPLSPDNGKASIYLTNTPRQTSGRSAFILENTHFEQGDNNNPYVWLDDRGASAFIGVRISGNTFGHGGPLPAVKLEKVRNVEFEGNRFAQTINAGGIPIEIDEQSLDINVARSNSFSTSKPVFAMPREEITFEPSFRKVSHSPLKNYNGDWFSTSVGKINMQSEFIGFPDIASPTGYWLNIQAKSSDSSPASVVVKQTMEVEDSHGCRLDLQPGNKEELQGTTCYVPADINGDFFLNTDTGPRGINLWITIVGFSM